MLATAVVGVAAGAAAQTLRPANLTPTPSSAEAGLWGASDRAERHVKTSAELDRDPELTSYVRGMVCKIAATYCPELRVYVLDRPVLNAAAAPNGYVEVNSGLLLRARTEDELAYVLGHEVTHFARNHSLERWSHMKNTANMMLVLQLGVAAGATAAMYSAANSGSPNASQTINSISNAAQSVSDLIYLAGLAAIFSFSRDEEMEADRLGFQRAADAGYDRSAGARMWRSVVAETQASDFPKVRKAEARASMFDTHPLTQERIDALAAMGGPPPASTEAPAQKRYRAVIRPHLDAWLRDDLRRRDYGQTLYVIDRLSEVGGDEGLLQFYRGEAYRQRRADGDAAAALKAYQASIQQTDAPLAAWRELGDAMTKAKDRTGAVAAYQAYLAKAETADDRWLVEANLKTLTESGAK
jgi:predicted Zn-dependent protease